MKGDRMTTLTGQGGQGGRANQKARTRAAIVDACRDLVRSGAEVTMPEVARRALVSEATAYRYFPDLISLLREALEGTWPDPAEALAPVAQSADPAARVAFACEYLLRGVHAYQGAVRAMMSHTITAPAEARTRPGIRFGLIDYALAPFERQTGPAGGPALGPDAMTGLKRELAVVVSAEAFFVLTDLCGLAPDDAIRTAARTAATLTSAAFAA
jgi:AcrR family transcriptional regulator